jgi:hypothetical protein
MKKIMLVLFLVIGFIVGWGTASVIAYRNIEKIKKGWTPEFQKFVAENVEFYKGLTKTEMEQLRKDIYVYNRHLLKEDEIRTLWQAVLAIQLQAALAKGNTNLMYEILAARINALKESRAKGHFKGSDLEKLADALVLRMETETNSPTTGCTVPQEADVSGVQGKIGVRSTPSTLQFIGIRGSRCLGQIDASLIIFCFVS